jgi:ABC-type multidrug transport system ATPase subunit
VEASITLRNVSKSYRKKYVLANLTLGIEKNTSFAIIGRNGAGKSMLLRVMATALTPDAGELFINGQDIARTPKLTRNCIGFLPDHDIHDCWLTGRENLIARADLLGISAGRFTEITEALVNDFRLKEILDDYPLTYSRGAKRCLDLVMVLMGDPEIIIMDEPIIGLDHPSRLALFSYLKSVKEQKTIIVASNEFTEIQTLADRWIVLDYGKIRFDGTLEKMLTRIDMPFTAEIILRNKNAALQKKIKDSGRFISVRALDLTIQVTFDKLRDFYDVLAEIPEETLAGIRIQALSVEEFLSRLLSDEE